MAFSDYKNIEQVQQESGIKYREESFIRPRAVEPTPAFQAEFEFNREHTHIFSSDASRANLVITPILREVYKEFHTRYSFWIQKSITYNEKLTGAPDYIIATRSALGKTVLEFPLVIVVEAKKNDFEQGWGQCLAELVAAQKLNGESGKRVYGIVTDGELWKFGLLVNDTFISNTEGYTVGDLAELFGALHSIFMLIVEESHHPFSSNQIPSFTNR
jgi:hypothetical protein